MTQATTNSGKMERIEEGSGEFVVSSGDGVVDLEVSNQSFDTVAVEIDAAASSDRGVAVGAPRDDGANASFDEITSAEERLFSKKGFSNQDSIQESRAL